jgi:hypothetical protein
LPVDCGSVIRLRLVRHFKRKGKLTWIDF